MSHSRNITEYIINQQLNMQAPHTAMVFMNIDFRIIDFKESTKNNHFTRALTEYGKDVQQVMIRNAPDMNDDLVFSKLRTCLPKLAKITFMGVTVRECRTIDQLKVCLLNGITLVLDAELDSHLRQNLSVFLQC